MNDMPCTGCKHMASHFENWKPTKECRRFPPQVVVLTTGGENAYALLKVEAVTVYPKAKCRCSEYELEKEDER